MIIDAHLHLGHLDRSEEETIAHLDGLGVAQAVLLPLEDPQRESWFPTAEVLAARDRYPERVLPFCHVDVTQDDALARIENYAEQGCLGFGEQKQHLPLTDPHIERVLGLLNELGWPATFHFQEGKNGFNQGLEYLETLLRKFPRVKFIGHAQSWWANISAEVPPPQVTLYPTGPVAPGGLADRLLSDYENMYADLSAGSGYGAISRDEDFSRGFLQRHRKKLLFATDCPCRDGRGAGYEPGCFGQKLLPLLRRLMEEEDALQDILYRNARRVLGLDQLES